MEKLSLEKFKDVEINDAQKNRMFGGTASSSSSTCKTKPAWSQVDTQTDFYTDACNDGDYAYVGSSMMTTDLLTQVSFYDSW
ncbi:hypothetical protein IMCC3317_13690 [Kordia antarctica]|uniref:Uncharacterized protein n=1 Tax=Kordia antarctica TaxID=1218801 RepID=A0A7L4ZIJ0_9FLAO|nr:hypothetical protein [Kordia antarctica]QHI36016.1 hypothetical protein IMCC3317_13690 [Kordia antarctica]